MGWVDLVLRDGGLGAPGERHRVGAHV
jgi:hypothetical protein